MNLTGETQPLVEQLMMVKRMQVGGRGGFSVPTASWPWRAGGRSLLVFPGRYRVSPALWQIMDPHRGGSVRWNGSAISPAVPGSRSGVREVSMLPGSDLPDPQGSGDWSGMGTLFFLTLGSSHSISPPRCSFWRSGKPALWGSSSLLRAQGSSSGQLSPSSRYLGYGSHREPVLGWFSGGSATPWTFAPGFSPPASSLVCQVPIIQKPQGSSARFAGLFCVLAHRCHESSPQPGWRGAALGAHSHKGHFLIEPWKRGSQALRLSAGMSDLALRMLSLPGQERPCLHPEQGD